MESMALKNNSVKKLLTPEVGEPISISPKTTERRITFPERLWECVNDATDLVKWSPKGDSVLVEEERFEKEVYVVPPQSWGDQGDTKHSKCLLLGGRRLNQMTLIPKPNGSGSARAATAQVGPANKRNDTKRCLPIEASLRPGEAVPW